MGDFLTVACSMLVVVLLNNCVVAEVELPSGMKPLNYEDSTRYRDCGELRKVGYNDSGIHVLYVNSTQPFLIHCEFTKDNTYQVIQRRQYGNVNFKQTYATYETGFGIVNGDFWAGLTHIYHLTQVGNHVLTIEMQDAYGNNRNAQYKYFSVGPWYDGYKLHVGGFQGDIPDDLSNQNGMTFQTFDNPDVFNCALSMHAGWWYNYCAYTLLNGHYYFPPGHYYPSGSMYDGIFWKDWNGYDNSLKFVQMKVSIS